MYADSRPTPDEILAGAAALGLLVHPPDHRGIAGLRCPTHVLDRLEFCVRDGRLLPTDCGCTIATLVGALHSTIVRLRTAATAARQQARESAEHPESAAQHSTSGQPPQVRAAVSTDGSRGEPGQQPAAPASRTTAGILNRDDVDNAAPPPAAPHTPPAPAGGIIWRPANAPAPAAAQAVTPPPETKAAPTAPGSVPGIPTGQPAAPHGAATPGIPAPTPILATLLTSAEAASAILAQTAPTHLEDAREPLPDFPTHYLPPWLRSFVEALATALQVPRDLVGGMALAILSTAAGPGFKVCIRRDWIERPCLYLIVISETGTRKSGAVEKLSAPMRRVEKKMRRATRELIAQRKQRRAFLGRQIKDLEKRALAAADPTKADADQRKAEQLAVELENVRVPKMTRFTTDDCTPERIVTMLKDQNGRLAVISPEGSDFVDNIGGRYARNRDPNIGVLLRAHSDPFIEVDRQNDREGSRIEDPTLSIGVTAQPSVLDDLMGRATHDGRGLLTRFAYVFAPALIGQRLADPPPVPDAVAAAYDGAVDLLFQLGRPDGGKKLMLEMNPEARALVVDFMEWIEARIGPGGELDHLRGWCAKAAGLAARIAGLLHLAENVAYPAAAAASFTAVPLMSGGTVARAVSIVRDYLLRHAERAFSRMGADQTTRNTRHVLAWIARRVQRTGRSEFSWRDVQQSTRGYFEQRQSPDKAKAALRTALDRLAVLRYVAQFAPPPVSPRGGRPAGPFYAINPHFAAAVNAGKWTG